MVLNVYLHSFYMDLTARTFSYWPCQKVGNRAEKVGWRGKQRLHFHASVHVSVTVIVLVGGVHTNPAASRLTWSSTVCEPWPPRHTHAAGMESESDCWFTLVLGATTGSWSNNTLICFHSISGTSFSIHPWQNTSQGELFSSYIMERKDSHNKIIYFTNNLTD